MVTDHHRIMKNTKKKERKLLSFSHLEIIFSSLTNLLANRNPFIYCRWWLLTSPMMMMIMMVVIFESIFFYLKKSMVIIGSKKKSNIWFNLKILKKSSSFFSNQSNDRNILFQWYIRCLFICFGSKCEEGDEKTRPNGYLVLWFDSRLIASIQ